MYCLLSSIPVTNRDYDNQLILLIGNYMNGAGIKGGAFGFRVSSINKVNSLIFSKRHPQCLTIRFPSLSIPSR